MMTERSGRERRRETADRPGPAITPRPRHEEGGCNFCHRDHTMVYCVKGREPTSTLLVRICRRCAAEIGKAAR